MIQRVQTLFLVLALAAMVVSFFFPMAVYLSELQYYKLYLYGIVSMVPDTGSPFSPMYVMPLAILAGITALLILVTIFLYRKRILQIRLLRIAFILDIALIGLLFFLYAPSLERETGVAPDYTSSMGIYFPLIALLFILLANRYIQKDERLVRSADRLR